MTNFIPENPIETMLNPMISLRFTWKTTLLPEKTKLEIYVDTLAAIANSNLLKQKSKCNLAYANKVLENKCALDFLSELGLVKQTGADPEAGASYYVTQRGKAVLKYFKYFDNLGKEQRT